ncbi:hypothetical protein EX30DRAFT_154808 [Ascodesmis nigricans]|uniref:Secreted protein n=1 Tax=Ascodesmis nigricans TaxID=341454 RepID=A0A4S2N2N8_9PEZI|nr:hypothetical protein EX30DRAFT_154808 [Ascodesmis nigricans]
MHHLEVLGFWVLFSFLLVSLHSLDGTVRFSSGIHVFFFFFFCFGFEFWGRGSRCGFVHLFVRSFVHAVGSYLCSS